MQTYLTTLNELLMQWYGIIMANPLYKTLFIAACAAAALWFLMLVYYQIKVVSLRGKLRKASLAHEADRKQLTTELETVKEQLQQTAIELDSKNNYVNQLEADKQATQVLLDRASGLEQKAKQLVGTLQTDFFLPALSEAQAADLSYSLNHAVQNLADRLRIAQQQQLEASQQRQQEQAALLEKETLIADLQSKIAVHTAEIQALESDFKAQKSNWQQEQAQLHQELQLAQASQQEAITKVAEIAQTKPIAAPAESFTAAPLITSPVHPTIVETALETVQHVSAPVEAALESVVANVSEVATEVEEVAEATVAKAGNQVSKFFGSIKGFGSKKAVVEETVIKVEAVVEDTVEEIQTQVSHAVEAVEELVTEVQESSQVSRFFGSIKNIGAGKKPAAEEVVAKVEVQAVEQKVAQVSEEAGGKVSKLKGMLSFKKGAPKPKVEVEATAEPEALLDSMVEKLESSNINNLVPKKLKDIYQKIMSV